MEDQELDPSIVAAFRALPEDIRNARATPEELAAFESELGPIPPVDRRYLEVCGSGVAGAEWLDEVEIE